MIKTYSIGIDNGVNGAIAIIDSNMVITNIMKYNRNNLLKMFDFLYPYKKFSHAVLERPFLGGKKNKGNEITYQVYGTHIMNLSALEIPFQLAEARMNIKNCWRKEFNFISKERDELKLESIQMVRLLFNEADKYLLVQKKNIKTRIEFCKPDDNIAEALLLAEYCRRINL